MIHGSIGAGAQWTPRPHAPWDFASARHRAETPLPYATSAGASPTPGGSEDQTTASRSSNARPGDAHRCCGGPGHARGRFSDVVGAAVFADRVQMEKRAEFRAEMFDIRSEIRGLIGEVEGGRLSAEQQGEFDGLVGRIVELRDSFGSDRWRRADAESIADRILHRFGIEPAAETATTGHAGAPADEIVRLTSLVASLEETVKALTRQVEGLQATADGNTEPSDGVDPAAPIAVTAEVSTLAMSAATTDDVGAPEEIETAEEAAETDEIDASSGETMPDPTELAEKLASVIANASALMDDLLEALAA